MMQLIKESLDALGVKHKDGPTGEDERGEILRLRIGGHDKRRITFKGWVELENFRYGETDGSFCLMTRDVVGLVSSSISEFELTAIGKSYFVAPAVESTGSVTSRGSSCAPQMTTSRFSWVGKAAITTEMCLINALPLYTMLY